MKKRKTWSRWWSSLFGVPFIKILMTSWHGNSFRITGLFVRGIHRSQVDSPHERTVASIFPFPLASFEMPWRSSVITVMWYIIYTWWRHQMEPFSASLAICAGNSPVTGEFPAQRPMTRSFDVFFDLNKRLSKQSWGWWLETPSRPLWRLFNETLSFDIGSSTAHKW